MNTVKHIKRFFKSCNKRVIQPLLRFSKPIIAHIKGGPYEIILSANKHFQSSDFTLVHNLVSYEHFEFNSWKISALIPGYEIGVGKLDNQSPQIYIIIDTQFHDAFSHWFFESAIWLPKIKFILDAHPNAKIHLKGVKGYKTQILEFFGITADQIATEFSQQNNLCIFVNPCTAFNDQTEYKKFQSMLADFWEQFHIELPVKKIDYLLMPRQKKGNYISNNREVNTDDLELYLRNISSSSIFNAEHSPTFADQINAVQSSKHILVPDGSAFLVNAFLAKNSVIAVLGDTLVPCQRQVQEKMRVLCEHIEHHNAVMYVHSTSNAYTRKCLEQWVK